MIYRLFIFLVKSLRVLLTIILAAVGAVGLANAWVVFSTFNRIVTDIPAPEHLQRTAIVLGSSPGGGFLQERLHTALVLYRKGQVGSFLLSGDGRGPFYDEVQFMRRFMLDNGVPESALLTDGQGLRTLNSMQRAAAEFELSQVIIISQRFHNFRALYLARSAGLDALAVDAAEPRQRQFWQVHGREWLARPLALWEVWFERKL